jgi:hypothetical protein
MGLKVDIKNVEWDKRSKGHNMEWGKKMKVHEVESTKRRMEHNHRIGKEDERT